MYKEADLVCIAKRENNEKRKYLVVNRLQGKHVPVKPGESLEMFERLAESIEEIYRGEKLLVVGFAETATAIGAAVAIRLGGLYMQTTREVLPGVDYLFFSEAHSHATEQKLVKNDVDKAVGLVDRILFVEDEVTTGNTILNIVDILEKNYPGRVQVSVASILNGMDEESLARYRARDIRVHYLVKTDHSKYTGIAESYEEDGSYIAPDTADASRWYRELSVSGWLDTRRLVEGSGYRKSCERLWSEIRGNLTFEPGQSALVIGTEEFMYPALFVAACMEQMGVEARCHATTRSPIAVCREKRYPLHCRYELKSLYDGERRTFIYDLARYDQVLILTDSHDTDQAGINSLVSAVKMCGSEKIQLIRWCEF